MEIQTIARLRKGFKLPTAKSHFDDWSVLSKILTNYLTVLMGNEKFTYMRAKKLHCLVITFYSKYSVKKFISVSPLENMANLFILMLN